MTSWRDPLLGQQHPDVPEALARRLDALYAEARGRHRFYEQMNVLLALNAMSPQDPDLVRQTVAQARAEGCTEADIELELTQR